MAYKTTDEFIEISGKKLECRWFGPQPDEAPTIVALHEGLGCVSLWRDFPDKLSKAAGMGVFVYSRAGYGRSDPADLPRPITYMHDEATETLPAVLDAIGFERGLLFGHSDGASIAAIYTGSIEDHRVRGLVLLAPHFFVEDVTIQSIDEANRDYESGDLRKKLGVFHGDNVDCAFKGWADAWLNPEFREWSIEDCIAHIRVPTQIVQGNDDKYGTRAQIDLAQDEAYSPVDAVFVDDCGHAPHLEKPEETLAATMEFIDRLNAMEGLIPTHERTG